MFDRDAAMDFDCPNCGRALTFTLDDLMSNEKVVCPACDLQILTDNFKAGIEKVEQEVADTFRNFRIDIR